MKAKIIKEERPNEIEVINTDLKDCCINPFDETVPSFEEVTKLTEDVIDICKKASGRTGEIDMFEVSIYDNGKTISNCAFPGRGFDVDVVPLEISKLDDNYIKAKLIATIFDLIRITIDDMRHLTEPRCNIKITRYCVTLVHIGSDLVKKIVIHCSRCISEED